MKHDLKELVSTYATPNFNNSLTKTWLFLCFRRKSLTFKGVDLATQGPRPAVYSFRVCCSASKLVTSSELKYLLKSGEQLSGQSRNSTLWPSSHDFPLNLIRSTSTWWAVTLDRIIKSALA